MGSRIKFEVQVQSVGRRSVSPGIGSAEHSPLSQHSRGTRFHGQRNGPVLRLLQSPLAPGTPTSMPRKNLRLRIRKHLRLLIAEEPAEDLILRVRVSLQRYRRFLRISAPLGCANTLIHAGFWEGHDFSRAVSHSKCVRASAPEVTLFAPFGDFSRSLLGAGFRTLATSCPASSIGPCTVAT